MKKIKKHFFYDNLTPFVWGFVFGLIVAAAAMSTELTSLQRKLDDPHHCVSTCVELFEKWGC